MKQRAFPALSENSLPKRPAPTLPHGQADPGPGHHSARGLPLCASLFSPTLEVASPPQWGIVWSEGRVLAACLAPSLGLAQGAPDTCGIKTEGAKELKIHGVRSWDLLPWKTSGCGQGVTLSAWAHSSPPHRSAPASLTSFPPGDSRRPLTPLACQRASQNHLGSDEGRGPGVLSSVV